MLHLHSERDKQISEGSIRHTDRIASNGQYRTEENANLSERFVSVLHRQAAKPSGHICRHNRQQGGYTLTIKKTSQRSNPLAKAPGGFLYSRTGKLEQGKTNRAECFIY